MKVRVLYFAALREKVGKSGEELSLDGDAPTVETLLAALRGRGGVWQAALSPENAIKCAVKSATFRAERAACGRCGSRFISTANRRLRKTEN